MSTPYQPLKSLREFHKAFSAVPFIEQPDDYGRKKLLSTRVKLLDEEFHETMDELLDAINGDGDWLNLAKELADMLYIIYGTADLLDINLEKAFQLVHESNMSKLDENGKPVLREDGKILKSSRYLPPDMSQIFTD